jgi:hypothetical protein
MRESQNFLLIIASRFDSSTLSQAKYKKSVRCQRPRRTVMDAATALVDQSLETSLTICQQQDAQDMSGPERSDMGREYKHLRDACH